MRASSQRPSVPQKKRNLKGCTLLLFVIRLGFAKMRCFTEDSGALLVLLVLVKELIYNVISVFIALRVNGKTLDFA